MDLGWIFIFVVDCSTVWRVSGGLGLAGHAGRSNFRRFSWEFKV